MGLLLPLVIIGVVIWLVRRSRQGAVAPDAGVNALRRLLQYGALLAAVLAATTGVSRLLAVALPAGTIAQRRAPELALGVALTIVALPIAAVLWRVVTRRLGADADERASATWSLALAVATTVSLIVATTQSIEIGRWLLGLEMYSPRPIAFVLAWSTLWAGLAWVAVSPRLGPTGPTAPLIPLAGATIGLTGMAVGGGVVLAAALREVYGSVTGLVLIGGDPTETFGVGALVAAVGALVWWFHWWRQARLAEREVLWHTYVLLVAVLGGLLTVLIAVGTGIHAALQWWLGVPSLASASAHFEVLPAALAAAAIGGLIWRTHHHILDRGPARARSEPDRVYDHLVSTLGLLAAAGGTTVLIMTAIQVLTPGVLAAVDVTGRESLAVAIALLLVGGPVWSVFWARVQRAVRRAGVDEQRAPTRRIVLVLLLSIGSLVATISLAVVLYTTVRNLLEGRLDAVTLVDLRVAIGLVITAGAVAGYHGNVYRRDRLALAGLEVARHPRDVLLVGPDGDLVRAVAASTGARVHGLHRLDVAPRHIDPEAVAAAILASPYDHVVVTIDAADEVAVIPYASR